MTGQAVPMPVTFEGPAEDPAARIAALFDLHHHRLFKLACRLAGSVDDAHDVLQETFLRAARSPGSIPYGHSSEEAWLVRVLVNICRDRWRATAVRQQAIDHTVAQRAVQRNPESAVLARAMVRHALQCLAPRRRAILVLFELDGVPVKEIAATLKMNAVTVRWHLSMARREMAKALGAGRLT